MSRRKTFKLLPRHTAKGRLVKMARVAIKNEAHKHSIIINNDKPKEKKSRESII